MTSATVADTWTEQYRSGDGLRYWPSEELVRFVARHYRTSTTTGDNAGAVLELGCGNGANLWYLARHFGSAHGIDASREALERCERLMAEEHARASLIVGDVRDLSGYADESFVAVVDVQCLQHLSFPEHSLVYAELARVLVPGGRFFSLHLGHGTRGYRRRYPDCGMVVLPDRRWLARVLRRAGFTSQITSATREFSRDDVCHYWVVDAERS